jgi:hypothetical protein
MAAPPNSTAFLGVLARRNVISSSAGRWTSSQEKVESTYSVLRACENASRWATNIAVGRFSPTVDIEDISHCIKISKRSFEAMVGGIDRYMQEYFDFPKFCDTVAAAFKSRKFISKRDLNREFFRRMRQGFELDRVIAQLIKQSLIQWAERAPPTGGHIAEGWEWIGD